MPFSFRSKELGVHTFILKVVNNSCPELKAYFEGDRGDTRVNLTLVVLVIPMEKKRLQVDKAFFATTKEFSLTGVSLVLNGQRTLDQVVLGVRWEGEMNFLKAKAVHLTPMGGGFHQLGLKLNEVLPVSSYPELAELSF